MIQALLFFVVFFGMGSLVPASEALPPGWSDPYFLNRVFRPHAMDDVYPTAAATAPRLIEFDIVKTWADGEGNCKAYYSRLDTDYFFVHYSKLPIEERGKFSKEHILEAEENTTFKMVTILRAIIAVDPTHPDAARLLNKDSMADLQKRVSAYYETFPTEAYFNGKTGPGLNRVMIKGWFGQPSEWKGRQLDITKDKWSPSNMVKRVDDSSDHPSKAVCLPLEDIVTAWQGDHGSPYVRGPNVVTRTWLWKDTWFPNEAPEFLSHLNWRAEQENTRVGYPVWTITNTTSIVATPGIDWAARTVGLPPHLIATRPPVAPAK